MTIDYLLTLTCGAGWMLTYIFIIHNGFKFKTIGMPFAALSLNIAWEFLYGYEGYVHHGLKTQVIINITWFCLDAVILYLYFKYGRKYFPKEAPKGSFIFWSVGMLILAALIQLSFYNYLSQIGDYPCLDKGYGVAEAYSSFLQNLIMSILFISQLYDPRRNPNEISFYVAIFKCIGTFSLALVCWLSYEMAFIGAIGVLILIVDVVYIYLLYLRRKNYRIAQIDSVY